MLSILHGMLVLGLILFDRKCNHKKSLYTAQILESLSALKCLHLKF